MFGRGRRWFTGASLALALVAALHSWAQLRPPPVDAGLASAVAGMRAYTFPFGSMTPSLWDVYRSVQFTMSVLLLTVAALNLALASAPDASFGLLRRSAALTALGLAALVALYLFYRVPPPLLLLAAVDALFVAAWLGLRRSA
jgi:hypothetical protein